MVCPNMQHLDIFSKVASSQHWAKNYLPFPRLDVVEADVVVVVVESPVPVIVPYSVKLS